MSTARRTRVSRQERRAQIVEAARDEFVAVGLQGARTKSIAARAGVTEALLYQHFDSKQALFQTAIVTPLERVIELIEEVTVDLPSGADDAIREAFRLYATRIMEAMRDSFPLLGVVLFADRSEGEDFYKRTVAPLLDRSVAIVEANLERWAHRPFDPKFSVAATFGMCWFLAVDAGYRGRPFDVDDLAGKMGALLFDGLADPNAD